LSKDLGDFQTPPALVSKVLQCLTANGQSWGRALEPTCGIGNFVVGLLDLPNPPSEIYALELQDSYVQKARKRILPSQIRSTIEQANIFTLDLGNLRWKEATPLLVVGNPPWVTNAGLGVLDSENLPQKTNFKKLKGLEALTGRANFDIAEYIWLRLITDLIEENPTIALLCKTSVARNVLQYCFDAQLPIAGASLWRIDAKKWFGAAVDACLFRVDVALQKQSYEVAIYDDLEAEQPLSIMGIANGKLVSDVERYLATQFADGICTLVWRQGVKHDAASVLELIGDKDYFKNKLGEPVVSEAEYVYPLLKSSDLFRGSAKIPRSLIVHQKHLGEDTKNLEHAAPRLWRYLSEHRSTFENRKSSIYRGKPPFALFGIGDYTFAEYKVAISGFHKEARFRAIGPRNGRPVVLDDTCYFVPCTSPEQAAVLSTLLNSPLCKDLIHSMVFWDSKRPITKKLLQRIDLRALLHRVDRRALLSRAEQELAQLRPSNPQVPITWPNNIEDLLLGKPGSNTPAQAALL
jgi:hypothetical protein